MKVFLKSRLSSGFLYLHRGQKERTYVKSSTVVQHNSPKALKPTRIIDFQIDEEIQIIRMKFPIPKTLPDFLILHRGKAYVTSMRAEQ